MSIVLNWTDPTTTRTLAIEFADDSSDNDAWHDVVVTEQSPWFTHTWRRPATTGRMAAGAACYLLTAVGLMLAASISDGPRAWLALAGAIGALWLGGTLAATLVWRRANPSRP